MKHFNTPKQRRDDSCVACLYQDLNAERQLAYPPRQGRMLADLAPVWGACQSTIIMNHTPMKSSRGIGGKVFLIIGKSFVGLVKT
jgi:hypothetical protein